MYSCPYCNAEIDPQQRVSQAKPLCPRCGEPLPAPLVQQLKAGGAADTTSKLAPLSPAPRPSNSRIGLAVLGGMGLLAVLVLGYALITTGFRRGNDFRVKKDEDAEVLPPGELSGLGYLPAGTNVALAVRARQLFQDTRTRPLLTQSRPALLNWLLGSAEKWAKVRPEEIDHVVAGTEISDRLPQLTLVIQTHKPVDADALAKAMLPVKPTEHRGQPLYRLALKPGEAMVWRPNPRVLVAIARIDAVKNEDLDAIPLKPRAVEEALTSGLREVMERLPRQSLVWAAGNVERTAALDSLAALAPAQAKAEMELWTRLRSFAVGVFPQEDFTLVAALQGRDAKAAAAIEERLKSWKLEGAKSFKVEGPPAQASDAAANWVTLQIRADLDGIREGLGKLGGK